MSRSHLITDFGAVADTSVNSSAAIQKAIDAAHAAGGGTVVVPAGKSFMTGSLLLKSFVRLHLEPGAVLLASPDIQDYVNYQHLELFAKSDFCRFWIFAKDARQVTIDGQGTLDANSPAYVSVVFLGCQDVVLHGIRLINTPSWALRISGCDRVLIEGISILNDLGLVNSDGIDIDCSRSVRIAHCHIEAGDDAISIKGRHEIADAGYGACEDIVVTGCVIESHCCAFRLGSESHVDFRRIVFSDSTIRRSHRGIAIDGRDDVLFEDVLISNITVNTIHSPRIWWHEGEPIWISLVPDVAAHYAAKRKAAIDPATGKPCDTGVVRLRNIVLRNISITSEQGIYVQGADGVPHPSDITFDNVRIHLRKWTKHPAGFFDPRPNRPGFAPAGSKGIEEDTPWGTLFKHDLPGFFFDRAENITLRNCRVTWADSMPAVYSHALEAHATPGLVLENFQGTAAHSGIPALAIHGPQATMLPSS